MIPEKPKASPCRKIKDPDGLSPIPLMLALGLLVVTVVFALGLLVVNVMNL